MKLVIAFSLFAFLTLAASSSELESLQASYEREKARVLAPVESKYDEALRELKLRHTRAGRLEEAVAVAAVIKSRQQAALSDRAAANSDWLMAFATTWKWHSGGELQIQPDGKCKHSSWKKSGTWKRLSQNRIEITGDEDRVFVATFRDEEEGEVKAKNGWKTKLSRINRN